MRKREVLTIEERLWIVRKRLNEDHVGEGFTAPDWRAFALDMLDVLDGRMGTLTREERERFLVGR